MNTTPVQTITFGGDGNARIFQISGWSDPETGYTWSMGQECALALPALDAPAGFLIELTCAIFRPVTLEVRVNDAAVASQSIDGPGTFVWQAPPTLGPVPIRLTFRHPDAQRPCDVIESWDDRPRGLLWQRLRVLRLDGTEASAPAIVVADPPENAELALAFASLGDDREFGRIQGALGAEPRGLPCFAEAALPAVRRGVETGWEALGDQLYMAAEGGEWITGERGYGLRWYASVEPAAIDAAALLIQERIAAEVLRRGLVEAVAGADRIFVVKSRDAPASVEQISALHIALNRGAPNWLLWVTADGEPGGVETIAPRLLHGHVSRFARLGMADDSPLDDWISVLRAAWRLARGRHREITVEGHSAPTSVSRVADASGEAQPPAYDRPPGAAVSEILFGVGENDVPHLISGWSEPETGIRWSGDRASRFVMTADRDADHFILELDCNPCAGRPGLPARQRVILRVNGQLAGRTAIGQGTTVAFGFQRPDRTGDTLEFTLEFPDAVRPRDTIGSHDGRLLAIAMIRARLFPVPPPISIVPRESSLRLTERASFETWSAEVSRLSGISAADLVGRFEGTGHDCEFGLFQRQCGAEPLGLFRFGDINIRNLIRGLDADFDGIDDPAFIDAVLYAAEGDFHIHHNKFGFRYHTYSFARDTTAEAVAVRHSKLLAMNRRIFLERIANAERIFVFKRNSPPNDAEALALYRALTRHGPSTLLYVTLADDAHPAGRVELVAQGLMKGYIDTFWTDGAESISARHWLEICLNAHALSIEGHAT